MILEPSFIFNWQPMARLKPTASRRSGALVGDRTPVSPPRPINKKAVMDDHDGW